MQVQRKKFFRIKTTDIGGVFYLYNGRLMFPITILESMVGFRFGEFVLTKRLEGGIHVKKKKKKKKK